ncbi:hypothetical protein [Mucilaginibacter sp.]|uniref:hypothetical protein n=1 Tax=Mucilaginibacter sp. TaxID=1882438 RepID=UPI0026079611|nr:hypothetical protein [Mucilaginibacter sp.]MDB4919851.1 putative phage lipoprotein [Mucilaginibacter sp.]
MKKLLIITLLSILCITQDYAQNITAPPSLPVSNTPKTSTINITDTTNYQVWDYFGGGYRRRFTWPDFRKFAISKALGATKDSTSVILPTISALQAYAGRYTIALVTDTLRGGGTPFNYVGTGTDDNVVTFAATAKGSGHWVRQYNKSNPVDMRWGGVTNTKTVAQNKAIVNGYTTAHPDAYIALRSAYIPLDSITISNNIRIYDQSTKNEIFSGQRVGRSTGAGGLHFNVQGAQYNLPGRFYDQPGSNLQSMFNTAKLDIFGNCYECDFVNYRVLELDFNNDYSLGTNGIAFIGPKGVGNYFGSPPTLLWGFQNGTISPAKLQYYDFDDTFWPTTLQGAWFSGYTFSTGDYITASNHLYQATTSGIAGSTVPSHTSGTVSDGGISWLFVKDYSGSESANFKSSFIIGDRNVQGLHGIPHSVRFQLLGDALIGNAKNTYWVGGTNQTLWTDATTLNGTDWRRTSSNGTNSFQRWEQTKNMIQNSGLSWTTATRFITNNSTTPNVDSAMMITFINTVPTPITNLVGEPYQLLYLQTGNTNTSLVYGTNIQTTAQENLVLLPNTTYIFQNNSSGVWQQVTPGLASATAAGIIGGSADQTFEPGKKIFQGNIDANASVAGSTAITVINSNGGTAADAKLRAWNGTDFLDITTRGAGFTGHAGNGVISMSTGKNIEILLGGSQKAVYFSNGHYALGTTSDNGNVFNVNGAASVTSLTAAKIAPAVTFQTPTAALTDSITVKNAATGKLGAVKTLGVSQLDTANVATHTYTGRYATINGSPTFVTQATSDNSNKAATDAWVKAQNYFSNPMTTLGDIVYGGVSGTAARLGGNITTTQKFLAQTGDGTNSAAPVYFDLFGTVNNFGAIQNFTGINVSTGISWTTQPNTTSLIQNSPTTPNIVVMPATSGTLATLAGPEIFINKTLRAPKIDGYTVATLPVGAIGMIAYVTDATAPTYLGTLTGGGTVTTPVIYNGTAWVSQ